MLVLLGSCEPLLFLLRSVRQFSSGRKARTDALQGSFDYLSPQLTSGGLSSSEADAAGSLLHRLTRSADAGEGLAAGRQIVAAVVNEPWYRKLHAAGFILDEPCWSQLRSWGSHDPMTDLSRIAVPTLAILGSGDPLVPAPQSMERYDASALLTGRQHRTVVFPDADHRLQTTATGEFAPDYLNHLSGWTHEQSST